MIVSFKDMKAEHRQRIRELRKPIAEKIEVTKSAIQAAEWEIRRLQEVLAQRQDELRFYNEELLAFDERHDVINGHADGVLL